MATHSVSLSPFTHSVFSTISLPWMRKSTSRAGNSRWTRDPVLDEGQTVVAYPTERDIEIFKLVARYRYLPSDYIHAFIGGNEKALTRRLNLLSRKPNLYLTRPHQQRESASANHRPLIYELDERAIGVLRERGASLPPKSYRRNFAHELMVAQITFFVPVITSTNVRMRSMMRLLEKMSGGGSKMFLFKTPRIHVIRYAAEGGRPHDERAVASRRALCPAPHFVINFFRCAQHVIATHSTP